MTLEELLKKRNATEIPLTVVVDRNSMSGCPIQRSDVTLRQLVVQNHIGNYDCIDCGDCDGYTDCDCGDIEIL